VPYGSNSYSTFITGSQAFNVGKLGTDRVGFYAMLGQAPTRFLTDSSGGNSSSGCEFRHREQRFQPRGFCRVVLF